MKLSRPLIFFDLETTGVNIATDRIVSIAVIKYFHDERKPQTSYTLLNPEIPIPKESTDIHGITDEMVKDKPTFLQISKSLHEMLSGSDLGGYNHSYFDVPLLLEEFLRVNVHLDLSGIHLVDACTIFKKQEPRTLSAAMKFFCNEEMEDAHNSLADTKATVKVFKSQLERYAELQGKSIAEVSAFCHQDALVRVDFGGRLSKDAEGDYIYTFGKAKGEKVKNDPGFGEWMMRQTFITLETKQHLTRIFNELAIK